MKKTIDFSSLLKFILVAAAVVTVIGVALLLIFGGSTAPAYTTVNISFVLIIKAVVAAILVFALLLLYFFIRYKKDGVLMAVWSSVGAVINAVVSFAFCVICRAPLGNFTFAVMLFSVVLTLITFVLFVNKYLLASTRRGKNVTVGSDFNNAANSVFKAMLLVLVIVFVTLAGGFVVSMIYSSTLTALYALPTMLASVFSVVCTLAFSCKLFSDKKA